MWSIQSKQIRKIFNENPIISLCVFTFCPPLIIETNGWFISLEGKGEGGGKGREGRGKGKGGISGGEGERREVDKLRQL